VAQDATPARAQAGPPPKQPVVPMRQLSHSSTFWDVDASRRESVAGSISVDGPADSLG
jgi:hypothetical protein